MINIIINDDNWYYLYGVRCLLSGIFKTRWRRSVSFSMEMAEQNIKKADVIIINLSPGEQGTCIPELRLRHKGIVIAMVDRKQKGDVVPPSCYQNIIYISRSAPLGEMRESIIRVWDSYSLLPQTGKPVSCFGCNHKSFSPQQTRVMVGLYQGKTVLQIAQELTISDRTVFAHKYIIMSKFNLKGTSELMRFLRRLATKNTAPNHFRECLEQQRILVSADHNISGSSSLSAR